MTEIYIINDINRLRSELPNVSLRQPQPLQLPLEPSWYPHTEDSVLPEVENTPSSVIEIDL